MDILAHIKELRDTNGWSNYRLAAEADITQSTLNNMFSRKTLPNIETLTKLCAAFQITLSQFFAEDDTKVIPSTEEEKLLLNYRKLNPKHKHLIDLIIKEMNL